MANKLNWEKANMRDKMKDQGSVDGRWANQIKHISRAQLETRGRALTDKERRSLHYVLTGERT